MPIVDLHSPSIGREPPALVYQISARDTGISPAFREKTLDADLLAAAFQAQLRSGVRLEFPPLPPGRPDTAYDGALIGSAGEAIHGRSAWSIPAVQPAHKRSDELVVYVNGMTTSLDKHAEQMQQLADATGQPVVGLHNSTEGTFLDITQCIQDELAIGSNPAVDRLTTVILEAVNSRKTLTIYASSQGGAITSRALNTAEQTLVLNGMTRSEVENRFSELHVVTYGGASWSYPDGPHYEHYVNLEDPVAVNFGLGCFGMTAAERQQTRRSVDASAWIASLAAQVDALGLEPELHPGRGAEVIRFRYRGDEWWKSHVFETYLAHRNDNSQVLHDNQAVRDSSSFGWGLAELSIVALYLRKRFGRKQNDLLLKPPK